MEVENKLDKLSRMSRKTDRVCISLTQPLVKIIDYIESVGIHEMRLDEDVQGYP